MQDTELYTHLLGVSSPSRVVRVELKVAESSVDVFVEQMERELPCPKYGVVSPVYDQMRRASVATRGTHVEKEKQGDA